MLTRTDFARVLLDHLDECPVCTCPRITFGVPAEGVCECECHHGPPEMVVAGWLHEDPDKVRRCNHVEGHRWCSNPNGTWTPLYKISMTNEKGDNR